MPHLTIGCLSTFSSFTMSIQPPSPSSPSYPFYTQICHPSPNKFYDSSDDSDDNDHDEALRVALFKNPDFVPSCTPSTSSPPPRKPFGTLLGCPPPTPPPHLEDSKPMAVKSSSSSPAVSPLSSPSYDHFVSSHYRNGNFVSSHFRSSSSKKKSKRRTNKKSSKSKTKLSRHQLLAQSFQTQENLAYLKEVNLPKKTVKQSKLKSFFSKKQT